MKNWTRSGWGWTLALLAWVVCGGMEAATVQRLADRGRWPGYRMGSATEIEVFGAYAYVHAGGFHVFDISDPNALRPAGGFGLTNSDFTHLACVSNYAVGTHHEGFTVIDLNDPTQPKKISANTTSWGFKQIALSWPYAYLTPSLTNTRISVFNLTNPAKPVSLGLLNATSVITALKVQGSTLYALTDKALQIFDLASPEKPQWVGTWANTNKMTDISTLGNYAFVPFSGGIQILDISHPSQPVPVSIWQPKSSGTNGVAKNSLAETDFVRDCYSYSLDYHLVIEGNYGYLTGGANGVTLIDFSDPVHPAVLGTYRNSKLSYYPFEVAVSGKYAFLANYDDGVEAVDWSNLAEPKSLSSDLTKMDVRCVAITGHYACLGHYTGGLTVVDISNPEHPTRTAFYRANSSFWALAASGNYVYLGNDQALDVLDISGGGKPVLVNRYTNSPAWATMSIAVSGNLACAVLFADYLVTLDLTDPIHPQQLGKVSTSWAAERVTLNGQYAYVTCAFGVVQVFDVSNPAHPSLIAQWNSDDFASQSAGWGTYIFEGHSSKGIQVLDFSIPSKPGLIASYNETPQISANDLALVDKTLYVVCWDGLRVLDTSNPRRLKKIGTASGFVGRAVAVGDRNVCATANENGLIVLDLYPEPPKLSVQVDASGYHLTLIAQVGRNVLIQRSTDLVHWEDWIVFEATGLPQTFTDPLGDNVPGQYYRASLLPN